MTPLNTNSIDLKTHWVGLDLVSPIVVGASPLTDNLEALQRCVEYGAGAVVMHSLFEEQIVAEQLAVHRFIDSHVDLDAEAQTFLPESNVFGLGPTPYLQKLRRLRDHLPVPVIASLNGTSPGGWCTLAKDIANAGASAIELNLYDIATSFHESGSALEARQLAVVESVVQAAAIPVIVKLSLSIHPYPASFARSKIQGPKGSSSSIVSISQTSAWTNSM